MQGTRVSKSRWLGLVGLIALCLIGAYFYFKNARQPAPEFAFTNLKGQQVSSQQLRGKVVIVNFWATSCTTCVAEMPELVETWKQFNPRGLELVAVAMHYDPPNYVLNFAETRQLPFHVTLDFDSKIAKGFGDIRLTPTTFVIDKSGKILKRYVGKPSFAELHDLLNKELA